MIPPVDHAVRNRRLAAGLFLALWALSLPLAAATAFGAVVPGWQVLIAGWSENLTLARLWLANPVGLIAAGWAMSGRRPPWWLAALAAALAFSSLLQLWPLKEVGVGYWVWLASFVPLAAVSLWERWRRPAAR